MYYAEHRFLGDTISLPKEHELESHEVPVTAAPLKLDNGLLVTYGEINGFAGDYFGMDKPISSLGNLDKMKDFVQRWFDLLAFSPSGKPKAEALRTELKVVNDQADKVLRSPSGGTADELAAVYKKTPLDIWHLDSVSNDAKWANGASFMQLLETNIDHFGAEARVVYNAGHAVALDIAKIGNLPKALAVNAFADHFLQDSFAAGHLRVPRAQIMEVTKHETYTIPKFASIVNASSNVMHEEDGELGLWVESPSGEKWKCFGDGRLPGKDVSAMSTSTNIAQCRKALQQSVQEVQDAYKSKQVIQQSQFTAWQHAPIIDKISSDPRNHLPLVKVEKNKISRRINGPTSKDYKETSGLQEWLNFYLENFSRVEDQVVLVVEKVLGVKLK